MLKIIPSQRLQLHLFYFLVSNVQLLNDHMDRTIPYHRFGEITPSYYKIRHLHYAITKIRPLLDYWGFFVVNVRNEGYQCFRSYGSDSNSDKGVS